MKLLLAFIIFILNFFIIGLGIFGFFDSITGTKYLDFYNTIVRNGGRCWLDPVQEFSDYDNKKSKKSL